MTLLLQGARLLTMDTQPPLQVGYVAKFKQALRAGAGTLGSTPTFTVPSKSSELSSQHQKDHDRPRRVPDGETRPEGQLLIGVTKLAGPAPGILPPKQESRPPPLHWGFASSASVNSL